MVIFNLMINRPIEITSSEHLALVKQLFILNPIPGQEAANSDFLLEHGAAAKVNRVEDLPFRIEQLLKSKKLVEMARAARGLGKPAAAQTVCQETVARVNANSRVEFAS